MIVHMTRVRVAGPSVALDAALLVLQDFGAIHLVRPGAAGAALPPGREARHLTRMLADVEAALRVAGVVPPAAPARPGSLPVAVRQARRIRRELEAAARAVLALEDERALLLRYQEFFNLFEPLLGHELTWPNGHAFYLVLRAGQAKVVAELERRLTAAVGQELELLAKPLPTQETAVLLLTSAAAAPAVSELLAKSRVEELPAPSGLGEPNLLRAMPALRGRLVELPRRLAEREAERARLAAEHGPTLAAWRAWLHDRLLVLEARAQVLAGQHLFVLEGWVPGPQVEALRGCLARALGSELLLEVLGDEPWSRADAPVVLHNPRVFRPFEVITRSLPLPRYGTIDPTPFVAIFFPTFFGLMLGDLGYGAVLGGLALLVRRGAPAGSRRRAIAAVAGSCALSSMLFGLLFGELFGDLGHQLGLHALAFAREEAILPFLGLSVALGGVHVLLGVVLSALGAWRRGHRREATGRGVSLLMLLLSALALLAAFEVLPRALFTPAVVAILVAFPLLVALEGVVAIIELLSTFGHVLSYARIMALGTASLMLAVVANQMVGAMGSVLVGVLFALLFHLVNFAIGVFSPAIHALRLHYVEFFGKFYSPGGTEYRPLVHWQPSSSGA